MRLTLKLHPESVCDAVTDLEVEVARTEPHLLGLRYSVSGEVTDLLLPPSGMPARTDGLWQQSCFEAFIRLPGEESYSEFNLSPSSQWAAYSFDSYRRGMEPLPTQPPRIETYRDAELFELKTALDLPGEGPWQIALSAVIEEKGGRKSYWALAHPADKADFHHPDSFVCELP